MPLNLGGLAMPVFTVLIHTAFISSIRKSARINAPTLVESAALKQFYLDLFPEVESACATLAALTKDAFKKELIYDFVLEGANNLGSTLSNMVYHHEAESLVMGMTTQTAVGHRSSRLPEAGTPFLLSHEHASRMGDCPFILALLMRICFPFYADRKFCVLCNKPADASVNHDLVCTKSFEKRASNRHTGVQDALLDCFKGCSHIDKGKYTLHEAQPNYSDFMVRTNAPAPAVGEPANIAVHKDATTTTTTNARICHPDFLIVCSAENELTNGKNILVDVTVAGPNAQSSHRAQHESGALAESADRRKILEVSRFWKHNDSVRVVPFAVEYTGGLGEVAR